MKRTSQTAKAGLLFPVSRTHRKLKTMPASAKRVSKLSAVYLTGVIEYLIAEILELSGNACKDNKRFRLTPRHILLAIGNDEELQKLFNKAIIPGGGVIPSIPIELLRKKIDSVSEDASNKMKKVPVKPVRSVSNKKTLDSVPTLIPRSTPNSVPGVNLTTLSEKTLKSGQKLIVLQGNIVNVNVDAVVHPTNAAFHLGGQVGSALSSIGGEDLRKAVSELYKSNGSLGICQAAISDSSPSMLCSKVIHVHSPSWNLSKQVAECVSDLDKAVRNILKVADRNAILSLALPSVSSGGNGYPKQVAAETILRSINSYCRELKTPSNIKEIRFVLYDSESVGVYMSELGKLDTSF